MAFEFMEPDDYPECRQCEDYIGTRDELALLVWKFALLDATTLADEAIKYLLDKDLTLPQLQLHDKDFAEAKALEDVYKYKLASSK